MTSWLTKLNQIDEEKKAAAYKKAYERFETIKKLDLDLKMAMRAYRLFSLQYFADEELLNSYLLEQIKKIVLFKPTEWKQNRDYPIRHRRRSSDPGLTEEEREAAAFILCNWQAYTTFNWYVYENWKDPIEDFIKNH